MKKGQGLALAKENQKGRLWRRGESNSRPKILRGKEGAKVMEECYHYGNYVIIALMEGNE
jgi:hypothetical protein